MRMLGGNCVLRRAVKNSEKKSENPLTSDSLVATRIMLCLAPGMLPALSHTCHQHDCVHAVGCHPAWLEGKS